MPENGAGTFQQIRARIERLASLEPTLHGSDFLLTWQHPQATIRFVLEAADILEAVIGEEAPEVVLIASTKDGKELAPRLAAKLDTGCISDAGKIYYDGGSLTAERGVYSGNAIAVEQFNSFPGIITVPGKVFDPLQADPGRSGEVVEKDMDLKDYGSKILDVQTMRSEGTNVEDAEIIVSCGRGFKGSEDLKLITDTSSEHSTLKATLPVTGPGATSPLS